MRRWWHDSRYEDWVRWAAATLVMALLIGWKDTARLWAAPVFGMLALVWKRIRRLAEQRVNSLGLRFLAAAAVDGGGLVLAFALVDQADPIIRLGWFSFMGLPLPWLTLFFHWLDDRDPLSGIKPARMTRLE